MFNFVKLQFENMKYFYLKIPIGRLRQKHLEIQEKVSSSRHRNRTGE